MNLNTWFSAAGMVVMPCWLLLIVAPAWRWTQRLATFVAPLLIAALYLTLLLGHKAPSGSGFSSLAQVAVLFSSPYALLAGWIHYAMSLGLSRWLVLPCLLLTFLFGPVGLALYLLLKLALRHKAGAEFSL